MSLTIDFSLCATLCDFVDQLFFAAKAYGL
jgi:hypothetical protein